MVTELVKVRQNVGRERNLVTPDISKSIDAVVETGTLKPKYINDIVSETLGNERSLRPEMAEQFFLSSGLCCCIRAFSHSQTKKLLERGNESLTQSLDVAELIRQNAEQKALIAVLLTKHEQLMLAHQRALLIDLD
jgi:hypothetical protein